MDPVAAMADPLFAEWFGRSVARDADGLPAIAWRGEHGADASSPLTTRHGALSFGDRDTALLYATNPNDRERDREAAAPRVSPWFLRIETPLMDDPDDPFLDLARLVHHLGHDAAVEVALSHASHVTGTGHWDETHQKEWGCDLAGLLDADAHAIMALYLPAHVVLDDVAACRRLRHAGVDGIICGGWGANACETEWRLLDASDALPALCWRNALDELDPRVRLRLAA